MLPATQIESYTQGLMDLGASFQCGRSRPRCSRVHATGRMCRARDRPHSRELPTPQVPPAVAGEGNGTAGAVAQAAKLCSRTPATDRYLRRAVEPCRRSVFNDDPTQAALARFGVETGTCPRDAAGAPHSFTHFRLHMHPLVADALGQRHEVRQSSALWLALPDALGAALPAPVRKLLEQL